MATSSILGTDQAPAPTPGRDTAALGPSDTTDSGSDIAGLEDDLDPGGPLDAIAEPDSLRPMTGLEVLGSDSDSRGTGERRSAGSDAGVEAADIAPDSIQTIADIDPLVDGNFNEDAAAGLSPEEARAREDAAADMVNASTLEDDDDLDEDEEADAELEDDDDGLAADETGDVPDMGDAAEDDEADGR
ncbi:hypothetical protein [Azohydromonas lata]|uniref:Chemotaxis protein n=1 Tax=Azohydromonas lata TaxID=45677 RepID=A0ABU5IIL4_9BURK|nr:hypothetical protein [Azohydromonas lata]MDZ5458679.1 hypothetical protein [Azohydromonas lata]